MVEERLDFTAEATQMLRAFDQIAAKQVKLVGGYDSLIKSTTTFTQISDKAVISIRKVGDQFTKTRTSIQEVDGVLKKFTQTQTINVQKAKEEAAAQAKLKRILKQVDSTRRSLIARRTALGGVGTSEEQVRLVEAQKALLRVQEITGKTSATVKELFRQLELGNVTAEKKFDGLRNAVLRVLKAEQQLGATARVESAKAEAALDKLLATRLKAAEAVKAELIALREKVRLAKAAAAAEREATLVRGTTRAGGRGARVEAGLTAGVGTSAERAAQSFLLAERNLKKLIATGKVTNATIQKAFINAERGALTFATATTKAEREVLKLLSLMKQLGPAAIAGTSAMGRFAASVADLGRLVGISLVIGSAFRLVQAFGDAAAASVELSIRLAEIDTIQTEAALSTDTWADSLIELSNAFGIPVIEQAEAAYQTLSNQVAQGTEAIKFLDAANRLAVTGVTDTAAAVNLLTSTINAFKLPVEDAELIAARFFKTVELGRIRIEEMAETFGRIALPASQLNVSLEELQAAIAVTTIQGVKFNEATTFIRNILLKLLRPTEALKALFNDLGVSSGEAAIETFGFGGFLKILEERTQGSSTELGELFGRIRAITGAMAFAGDNVKVFEQTLAKIEETNIQDFLEDTNKILDSTGQQLRRAREQFANFFEKEIGKPATRALAAFIKDMGGVENILNKTAVSVVFFGKVLISGAFAIGVAKATIAIINFEKTLAALQIRLAALATINPFVALAAAAAITATIITDLLVRSTEANLKAIEDANLAELRIREESLQKTKTRLSEETQAVERELLRQTRALQQEIATRSNAFRIQSFEAIKSLEEIDERFKILNRNFVRNLGRQISANTKLFKKVETDAREAAKSIESIFVAASSIQFEANFEGAGTGQQIALLTQRLQDAQLEAQKATQTGDFTAFQKASKRITALSERRQEAQIELSNLQERLAIELEEAQDRRLRARSRSERENANSQIRSIQRRQALLQAGSQADIDAAKQFAEILNRAREVGTFEAFENAQRELQSIRREQELINDSVGRERNIRQEGLKVAIEQAKQLAEIQRRNEASAIAAQAQTQRLTSAKLVLELINKEAADFSAQTVFAADGQQTVNERITNITEEVQQQQKRYAQLIELQRELGGGAAIEAALRERSILLQTAAEAKIREIREQERSAEIRAASEAVVERLALAKELATSDQATVDRAIDNLERIQVAIDAAFLDPFKDITDEARKQLAIGREFGKATGDFFDLPQPLGITAEIPEELRRFADELNRIVVANEALLDKLREQREAPTLERAAEIDASIAEFTAATVEIQNKLVRQAEGQPGFLGPTGVIDRDSPVAKAITSLATAVNELNILRRDLPETTRRLQTLQDLENQNKALADSLNNTEEAAEEVTEEAKNFAQALAQASSFLQQQAEIRERVTEDPTGLGLGEIQGASFLTGAGSLFIRALEIGAIVAGKALGQAANETQQEAASDIGEEQGRLIREGIEQAEIRSGRERGRGQAAGRIQGDGVSRRLFIGGTQSLAAQQAKIFTEIVERNQRRIEQGLAPLQEFRLGAGAPDIAEQQRIFAQQQEEFIRAQERTTKLIEPNLRTAAATEKTATAAEQQVTQQATTNVKLQAAVDALRVLENRQTVDPLEGVNVGSLPPAFADGGPVHGPGGRDNVLARLSAGEFVVRNGPSQRFRTQLLAMNTGRLRPRGYADGGEVTNNNNITVNESSSPQVTARAVADQLNRNIRRRTIRIRK